MKHLLLLILLSLFFTVSAKNRFTHDVKTEKKPWTHENFQNQNDEFSFIIIPDRTGGERKKGIWASALEKANMFHPDFIISVGDMVEGINKPQNLKKEVSEAQYAELRKITAASRAPFFHVVGNHDISRTRPGFPMVNEMNAEVWKNNFGVSYYSFIYKNVLFLCLNQQEGRDSRPTPCGLTPEQTRWALETLKKHQDVRWTIIFIHSPWSWNDAPFRKIEKQIKNRNYTVFSGDFHFYNKFRRYGKNYYLLATAGGVSGLRGVKYGEFDHITYVTVTADGPKVVNILLDGILPDDVVTSENTLQPKAKQIDKEFERYNKPQEKK